ncbi:MAG: hypothetical protein ACK5FE_04745, partial [Cyanobacteriota bacterium]
IASMATLALNSGLWVRRLLIGGSPDQGRYPASETNDGACPEKPVQLRAHCTFDQRNGQALQPADLRFLQSGQLGQKAPTPSPSGTAGIVRISPDHGQRIPTIRNMATDWALVVL